MKWVFAQKCEAIVSACTQVLSSYDELAWKIAVHENASCSSYGTKGFAVETINQSDRFDITLTVYVNLEKNDAKLTGTAAAPITTDNQEILKQVIDDLIISAKLAVNPAYGVVKKELAPTQQKRFGSDDLWSAFTNQTIAKKVEELHFACSKKKLDSDILANDLEILTNVNRMTIKNSLGVNASFESGSVQITLTMTAKGKQEQEYHVAKTYDTLAIDVHALIDETVRRARDMSNAVNPPDQTGSVILSGDALHEFFCASLGDSPLIVHCSARLEHMGLSRYSLGEPVVSVVGESLTLKSDPYMTNGTDCVLFDNDGVCAKPFTLIDNGRFVTPLCNNQYSAYTRHAPSGPLANIIIGTGTKSAEELCVGEHVEIVQFSWFNPNDISGDVSAEIRLGYVVKDGVKTPFRGGMLTGNVFTFMQNVYFSKEKVKQGNYQGPKILNIKNARIAGLS